MTDGSLGVAHPWWLLALPLAALPWLVSARRPIVFSSLALLPRDAASDWLDRGLRALASLTIAVLVLALAGPYRAEYPVERVGRGAEIALVLDRSRSMDQAFMTPTPAGGYRSQLEQATQQHGRHADRPSKGQEARRILAAFAARRPDDRFATLSFSTLPVPVHDFTHKQEIVQAAIAAGAVGRGLAETDIGLALLRALDWFDARPYSGSRIVLLVSDGGDHLDPDVREQVTQRMRDDRVSLYWIYIRSARSPRLVDDAGAPIEHADTVPEYFLHRFFRSMGTPYRAYEADDPQSLERAVADVSRLENLPITIVDTVPRRDLAAWAYAGALAGVLLLLAARGLELRSWA